MTPASHGQPSAPPGSAGEHPAELAQVAAAVRREPATGEIVLECRGIGYVYPDGTVANRNVSFSLRSGEIVSLLGPNGAGKTTLLGQISGDLRTQEGVIRVKNHRVADDRFRAKQFLGIAPQNAGVFSALTVSDHLRYFGQLKNLGRRELAAEADRVLRECSLVEQKDVRADRLSGGQQRKLIVALAILGNADILLLDEPTVGLDLVSRRVIWNALRRQRDEGKAILLTTHYMEEAQALSDRIAFMKDGTTVRVGTLKEHLELVSKSVRLESIDPERGGVVQQWYFDSLAEAQAAAQSLGLARYSVGDISLEDVYLRLMGPSTWGDA